MIIVASLVPSKDGVNEVTQEAGVQYEQPLSQRDSILWISFSQRLSQYIAPVDDSANARVTQVEDSALSVQQSFGGSYQARQDMPFQAAYDVDWYSLLSLYGGWDVSTMLRIIDCESSGDPTNISPPDAYDGLPNYGGLQLHGDPEGLNPEYAVDQAYMKYQWALKSKGNGYWPWIGSSGCWA